MLAEKMKETEFTQESLLGNSDNGAIKRNLEVTKNIQLGQFS